MNIISQARKEVMASFSNEKCCIEAFLYGIYKGAGYVALRDHLCWIGFRFTDEELLNFCSEIIIKITDSEPTLTSETRYGGKTPYKSFNIDLEPEASIKLTKLLDIDYTSLDSQINFRNFQNECCKKALLKGLFLSTGTLSVPKERGYSKERNNNGYYLEMKVFSEQLAEDISSLMLTFGIDSKIRNRKLYFSVYIKDAEKISDFLAAINAVNTLFKLQDLILFRSLSNDSNRGRNCNMANINKVVDAAAKQLDAINFLKKHDVFENLDIQLKETAQARTEHPELSLAELADLLGNVSKSGINHRMRKILCMAEDLKTANKPTEFTES